VADFERASEIDAKPLTAIQVRTFDDDSRRFAGMASGGPPGYDSPEWQVAMMRKAIYYKITEAGEIIGGMIVLPRPHGEYNLGRIYVAPEWQGKGIGRTAIEFLHRSFSDARLWTLETPAWAVRNFHLYEALGYRKVGQRTSEGLTEYLYERRTPPAR